MVFTYFKQVKRYWTTKISKINHRVGNNTCFLETIEEFLRFYLQGWKHPSLIILVCLPVAHVSVNYSDTPGKTNMDAEHGRVPGKQTMPKSMLGVYMLGCISIHKLWQPGVFTFLILVEASFPNEWTYGDTFTFKIYVNKTFRYLNCQFSHKSMQYTISYPPLVNSLALL